MTPSTACCTRRQRRARPTSFQCCVRVHAETRIIGPVFFMLSLFSPLAHVIVRSAAGANRSYLDDDGQTPLHAAIANGHVDSVERLTAHLPCDEMHVVDKYKMVPMHAQQRMPFYSSLRMHALTTALRARYERSCRCTLRARAAIPTLSLYSSPAARESPTRQCRRHGLQREEPQHLQLRRRVAVVVAAVVLGTRSPSKSVVAGRAFTRARPLARSEAQAAHSDAAERDWRQRRLYC